MGSSTSSCARGNLVHARDKASPFRARLFTYISVDEPGTSLKASGWWIDKADTGGGSWSRKGRERGDHHPTEKKVRWAISRRVVVRPIQQKKVTEFILSLDGAYVPPGEDWLGLGAFVNLKKDNTLVGTVVLRESTDPDLVDQELKTAEIHSLVTSLDREPLRGLVTAEMYDEAWIQSQTHGYDRLVANVLVGDIEAHLKATGWKPEKRRQGEPQPAKGLRRWMISKKQPPEDSTP